MEFSLGPIHKYPEYLNKCCNLINSEWKRSETARLKSIEASCDYLPVSLILLRNNNDNNNNEKELLGHAKLSKIPSIKTACFLETVVIASNERGKGFGTVLMNLVEDYSRKSLNLQTIFLSTKGQEKFYEKLGYEICGPISIYGSFQFKNEINIQKEKVISYDGAPSAPPLPQKNPNIKISSSSSIKIFMKKQL